MKRVAGGFVALILLLVLVFLGTKSYFFSIGYKQPVFEDERGIRYISRVADKTFQILDAQGEWQDSFLAGVNLGLGIPGAFPGEYAISYETYFQWFTQIARMGSNTIRVYTPQTPGFYQALYEYNRLAATPLYLLQGVYMDESDVARYSDVFAPGSIAIRDMSQDIIDCVNMLHGNAVISEKTGKASGVYRYDVSEYVIGWILGIECEAHLVEGTNLAHPEMTSFEGEYVYAKDVSPFEVFIAQMKELAIAYETENYRMQRPVAFSNWPTTDPLKHPNEPYPEEDSMEIDVDKIKAKPSFAPGFFASYHVYPYYPDFLNFPSDDLQTDANPYLAYLKRLVDHHRMPVIISEFGLPSSRGVTHVNYLTGLNQGGHSEQSQGEGLISMLDDIHASGCMGGIVFSWQDEWFKRSWNTMDVDDPDTRPLWHNVQSSEVNFGLTAFKAFPSIQIDGQGDDWKGAAAIGEGLLAQWDESYLYLRVEGEDVLRQKLLIPIDSIAGQGSGFKAGARFERAADFLLVLDGKENTRLLIDPYYNAEFKLYGKLVFSPDELSAYEKTGTGEFNLVRQTISRALKMPLTGQVIPPQLVDTGKLVYGISNPDSEEFNSLGDFCAGDGFAEIRIPWMLLNFADPSAGEILGNLHVDQQITRQTIKELYIGLGREDGSAPISMSPFKLPSWKGLNWTQRMKSSYDMIAEAFHRYATYPLSGDAQMQRARRLSDTRLLYIRLEHMLGATDSVLILLGLSTLLALYLFFVLVAVNIRLNITAAKHRREWEHLRGIMWLPGEEIDKRLHRSFLCSPSGLDLLSQFLTKECSWESGAPLIQALRHGRYEQCMLKIMKTRDVQMTTLVIRVAGQLRLKHYEYYILEKMAAHKDNPELLYAGLLSLSLMGRRASLLHLCEQPDYTRDLSFRSLKEIFAVYSGDKAGLFKDLLDSSDPYVRRIAIKDIGDQVLMDLADALLPMMDTEDANLLNDLIRTFGQLRFAPAGQRISGFMQNPNWTIRNAAVMALAAIDARQYLPSLIQGLKDKEWWVRYNSAKELRDRIPADELQAMIPGLQDRFAGEILRYALEEKRLMEKGGSDS